MEKKKTQIKNLDEEDKEHIRILFQEEIVPKLTRLGARTGTLNCTFAGERYQNWNVRFQSSGPGFEITEFEYDEDSETIDLDL